MNIPLFDLNYGEEEISAVTESIRDNWISMGPKVAQFESEFKSMIGAKYAVATTNCTSALHLALYAANIKDGDEVICPSLTFSATVNCIKYVGAVPVFCDIKSKMHLGIDADLIEQLVNERTRAIIPMHYAGFPCEMDKIMRIAKKYKLVVVEDSCHGPTSEFNGEKLGTIGDIGCFSFYSNKNISTGEGGMLVTDNKDYYNICKLARSHGMTTLSYERAKGHAMEYDIKLLGYNYRMDDIRGALGCAQLKKLDEDIKKRKAIRRSYIERLKGFKPITIPYIDSKERCSNYIFPIVLNNSNRNKRNRIRERLKERGIQTSVHYPAVHRFDIYKDIKCTLPNTEYVADNEVTLPMYGNLSEEQVEYICTELKQIILEEQ